jgi:hypothetical protein
MTPPLFPPLVFRQRSLSAWELPQLLVPVHAFRQAKRKQAKDRPHFAAILGFIVRNRFAIGSQIQRRFADRLRSGRTTRRHLEEMESLGYLGVAPTRSTSPLFPKVFYVTGRGVKRLQQAMTAQGKSWEPSRVDRRGQHRLQGYSSDKTLHEVLTTEFLLALWQTMQHRPDLELLTVQRRSLVKHPAFHVTVGETRGRLVPDAMFVFRQKGGGMICSFLELDRGTMNRKQMRSKFRRYEAWSVSEAGQRYLVRLYEQHGAANPRPTFRVLLAVNDRAGIDGRRRLVALYRAALDLPSSLRDRLWFTTQGDLRDHQHDPLPLGASIWRRGRDAHGWLAAYRRAVAMHSTSKEQLRFVREQIAAIPNHPLLPLAPEAAGVPGTGGALESPAPPGTGPSAIRN